jgi:uncharacterized membrane protein
MSDHNLPLRLSRISWLGLILFVAVLTSWLYFAPPGLLGKADAVGYAVCHRISVRSFHLGERQLPLCARCSGMYIGAFVGFLLQLFKGRKGGFPPLKILIFLGLLLAAFGVDGVNSYLHLMPNFAGIYEPNNVLRLITGTGVGVGMSILLMPIIHQTFWQTWDPEPAVNHWKDLFIILTTALATTSLMLTENPLLLYPLAIISAATVVCILGLIYTIVWIMLLKKENAFTRWSEVIGFLGFGFGTAILQVLAIDIARLLITGSWNGFNFL